MLGSITHEGMAISRGLQSSDIDKRLKILRQQVYGGKNNFDFKVHGTEVNSSYKQETSTADIAYLRKDLLKITMLATLAVSLQLFLFFALRNNIIKLPI